MTTDREALVKRLETAKLLSAAFDIHFQLNVEECDTLLAALSAQQPEQPQNPCTCVPDGDDGTVAHLCKWHLDHFAAQGGEQSAEMLAQRFHEAYERLAPQFGYVTRKETREFDKETSNGRLMIAVCDEIIRGHDRQALKKSAEMVSVPRDKDNPIVGHKTLQNGEHIPLRKDEADALIAQVRLSEKQRRAAMPDEKSAINTLFNAWIRLKDFGWRDADYCPKDGSSFLALECGSTGIHTAHYQGDQFKGSIWIESNGDLWPSKPVLFKPAAAKEGK